MFDTDMPFLEYFCQIMEKIKEKYSITGYKNWYNSYNYLKGYCSETTTFNDITPEWCEGFKASLDNAETYSHKQISSAKKKTVGQNKTCIR